MADNSSSSASMRAERADSTSWTATDPGSRGSISTSSLARSRTSPCSSFHDFDGRHIAYGSLPTDPDGPLGAGFQIHVVEIGPNGEVLDDTVVPHAAGASDNEPEFLPQACIRLLFQRTTSDDIRSLAMVRIQPGSGGSRLRAAVLPRATVGRSLP